MTSVSELMGQLQRFSEERDWAQFHTPRNLAMAMAGEVGEVLALLQWVPSEEMSEWLSEEPNATALRHEVADVLAYLLQFADAVGVDPLAALEEKIELNAEKYPVALARGRSIKYTELTEEL